MSHLRSQDCIPLSATSALPPSRHQSRKAPLAARSANYHTSPAVKSSDKPFCSTRHNIRVNQMPETTQRLGPLHDSDNGQIPDLCPVSQLGHHATIDYSLSEIEFPDTLHRSTRHSPAIDSLSPEPVRVVASHTRPSGVRTKGSKNLSRGTSAPSISPSVAAISATAPVFELDHQDEAVLGAYAPGDATMLESEEFSMISVDSLPSRVAGHSSPSHTLQPTQGSAPVHHSYMPSSPPPFIADRRTPIPEDMTPENPKAPLPAQSHDPTVATPLRESARKSGRALQDALNGPFRESVSRELPAARESIFNGFSSGTRHQLRESPRTGQSLASASVMQNAPSLAPTANSFSNYLSPFHSPVRPQETFDQLPARLLTPEPEARSQSVADPYVQSVEYPQPLHNSTKAGSIHKSPDSSYVNVRSLSVSQVQSPPSTSPGTQQIVAEHVVRGVSSTSTTDEDDKDIWQEEASRSLADDEDSPQQTDLFLGDLPVKPQRGTCRRTSGADFSYSDSPEPQQRESRKVSASTVGSSRKSSGVITPPSSDDGSSTGGEKSVAQKAAAVQSIADDEANQSESGDDTGMFFQANLPSVYHQNTKTLAGPDLVKSSFAPSSPLRNTFLEISPTKPSQAHEDISSTSRSNGPSSVCRKSTTSCSSENGSVIHNQSAGFESSETQTDSSLASDAQQLQREMRRQFGNGASTISSLTSGSQLRESRRVASANTIDLTATSFSDRELSVISSRSRSYQEELNLESPMRVKVNFNDDAGNSTLLEPKRQYPPLFDNVPTLSKPSAVESDPSQPKSPLIRLTESFWEAVTKPPVYASPERKPSVVLESQLPATVPDHVLRLRRKYGLLPDTHPFVYAHIRTLHRMLNSARSRPGSSIVPRSGPLGHGLSRLLGKSRNNELDQRFVWTQTHLHVVDSFMSLLLPLEERDRLQYDTGSWGDAEALRHRGRDSKGRYGDEVVFNGVKGGLIEASWVADVLVDIVFKEEMNAKKKKIAEMMSRAERMGA